MESIAGKRNQLTLVKQLQEYKDIILLLLFFSSGVSWIYGYFATKVEAKQSHCYIEQKVSEISNTLDKRILLENLKRNRIHKARIERLGLIEQQSEDYAQISNEIMEAEKMFQILSMKVTKTDPCKWQYDR